MVRTKSVPDEEVLSAALEVLIARGNKMTLADVGDVVGLSAPAVVSRFGTKRELRLQVRKRWAQRSVTNFSGPGSPLDRLMGGLLQLSELIHTKEQASNLEACVHLDFQDPKSRVVIQEAVGAQCAQIAKVLDEAIAAGQLRECDPQILANQLQVVSFGARQLWAIAPESTLVDYLEQHLREFLAPWLTPGISG